jgi:hypothetical protein
MRGREAQQLCMFMSCTALIFVLFLYFQKSREGLENKKEAKKVDQKVEKEAKKKEAGGEVLFGKNWKIKAILPDAESTKKALKSGIKNPPKNLAIMARETTEKPWKEVLILKPDGNLDAAGKLGKIKKKVETKKP